MDYEIACRCCLSEVFQVKKLHSDTEVAGKNYKIKDMLNFCFGTQIESDDGYPQNICMFCLRQLQMSSTFKMTIENAFAILERHSQNMEANLESSETEMKSVLKMEVEVESEYQSSNSQIQLSVDSSSENKSDKIEFSLDPDSDTKEEVLREEPEGSTRLYCTNCDTNFVEAKNLYNHYVEKHKPKNRTGKACKYCNEKFPNENVLDSHEIKHFTPFICPWCRQGFVTSRDFDKHINLCEKYESPRKDLTTTRPMSQCNHCGKSYPRNYIQVHMKIHGESKYQCKICNKAFKQPTSLNHHMRHAHSDAKTYKCKFCDKAYKSSSGKQAHVRMVHNNERSKLCGTCGKAFFFKGGLDQHMLTHTGVKNYICDICDKAYQSRFGLNVHMRSHKMKNHPPISLHK